MTGEGGGKKGGGGLDGSREVRKKGKEMGFRRGDSLGILSQLNYNNC